MNSFSAGVDDTHSILTTNITNDAAIDGIDITQVRAAQAVTMTLTGIPISHAALTTIDALASAIYEPKPNRPRPSAQYHRALGAAIADLANAASYNPPRTCFRHMSAGAFSAGMVGYHPFVRVIDDLSRQGYVTVIRGQRAKGDDGGFVTRILPKQSLIAMFTAAGITAADRLAHFSYVRAQPPALPIQLKTASQRTANWKKIPGKKVIIDANDPEVIALAAPVVAINRFLAKQRFHLEPSMLHKDDCNRTLDGGISLFRGFNCSSWQKGGRLNPYGGSYHNLKKESRRAIRINGMDTVEVDISSCHLTIAYSILNKPLPDAKELYTVGLLDRLAVKLFVNYVLGGGKVPTRWTAGHMEKFDEHNPERLSKEFPVKVIAPQIMNAMPILQEVLDKDITWGDFQNTESNIMMRAVYILAFNYDICSLPVHDSYVVPSLNKEIAISCLSDCFLEETGFRPLIKLK